MLRQCHKSLANPPVYLQIHQSALEKSHWAGSFMYWSRIHERTISLRFLGIILRLLRLEVSVSVLIT